jgi:hypothetical protein
MAKTAGVGIGYVEDENGKLVKKRAGVRSKTPDVFNVCGVDYVYDENGRAIPYVAAPPPDPKPFSEADRERVKQTRDRYTRGAWSKMLRDIFEGRIKVSREQLQALLTYGRAKDWNRKRSRGGRR